MNILSLECREWQMEAWALKDRSSEAKVSGVGGAVRSSWQWQGHAEGAAAQVGAEPFPEVPPSKVVWLREEPLPQKAGKGKPLQQVVGVTNATFALISTPLWLCIPEPGQMWFIDNLICVVWRAKDHRFTPHASVTVSLFCTSTHWATVCVWGVRSLQQVFVIRGECEHPRTARDLQKRSACYRQLSLLNHFNKRY